MGDISETGLAIVPRRGCPYLLSIARVPLMQTAASETAPSARFPRSLLVIAAAMGILLGGTLVLWAQYGAAVFFDMIAAGIAACF